MVLTIKLQSYSGWHHSTHKSGHCRLRILLTQSQYGSSENDAAVIGGFTDPRSTIQHNYSTFCCGVDLADLFIAYDLGGDENIRKRSIESLRTEQRKLHSNDHDSIIYVCRAVNYSGLYWLDPSFVLHPLVHVQRVWSDIGSAYSIGLKHDQSFVAWVVDTFSVLNFADLIILGKVA